MIKPIIRDILFLARPSATASLADRNTAMDLLDTLKDNADCCVGMAANMIGVSKRIIVVDNNGTYLTMYNPELIAFDDPYETEESCLSLLGSRKTTRYKTITVRYQDSMFRLKESVFSGFTAQIIQHEIDHCNGIII